MADGPQLADITAALDASLQAGMKPGDLADLLMERKRLMDLTEAKKDQPELITKHAPEDVAKIQEALFAPLPPDPNPMYGLDLLVQTVVDTANTGNSEDVLFAALRVVRKCWGMMAHLPPIETTRKEKKADETATVSASRNLPVRR